MPGGRPRKQVTRERMTTIRLTHEQHDEITAEARAARSTVSDYIRLRVLTRRYRPPGRALTEILTAKEYEQITAGARAARCSVPVYISLLNEISAEAREAGFTVSDYIRLRVLARQQRPLSLVLTEIMTVKDYERIVAEARAARCSVAHYIRLKLITSPSRSELKRILNPLGNVDEFIAPQKHGRAKRRQPATE